MMYPIYDPSGFGYYASPAGHFPGSFQYNIPVPPPPRMRMDRVRRSITPVRRRYSDYQYARDRSRYRSRSYSRSRSRSPPPRRNRSKYTEPRSRSRSPYVHRSSDRRRSPSRSPLSQRRRHVGTRENPYISRCLGIFGLSVITNEEKIREIFSKYGNLQRVNMVLDAKTGKSRGFCFVYFESLEDAKVAKEHCSGIKIDDRCIRVDYSITKRAHTPTPGVYMGKATSSYKDVEYHDRYREAYVNDSRRQKHSASPHRERKRRYGRSKSKSYSPRNRRLHR